MCLQWRCLPGGVHLIRAASCRSPAQYSHTLLGLCVHGRPHSYSSLDQTGRLLFLPPQLVYIAANMHQRYRMICHLTSLLLESCCVGNEFERGKTRQRCSFFRWAQQKVAYIFTGLYSNLSVPLQRETPDVDHHKRCSLWRVPGTHQAQAEEVKGGNAFTSSGPANCVRVNLAALAFERCDTQQHM